MEQIFNDESGNVITVKYDEISDIVSVNNNFVDSDYHEIKKCNEEVGPKIFCIDGVEDELSWSDTFTRLSVGEFFWVNKVNP